MLNIDMPDCGPVSRVFFCKNCGQAGEGKPRGPLPDLCSACRLDLRRERDRDAYFRKQGREPAAGIGTIGSCCDCRDQFRRNRADHVRCKRCAQDRLNAYNRAKREVTRRALGRPRRNGEHRTCGKCLAGFTAGAANQVYCRACRNTPTMRYIRERRKTDPQFALLHAVSAAIRKSLRSGKSGRSWERLVGYTVTELMTHLERQFLPGMTWDNRGDWHIDHIVPLSSFEFTSPDDADFQAAWALTNLRPLWAKDNIRKSAKRTHLI